MIKEIDCIIQARMDSSRLPGKVIMPILKKPLLAHIIERIMLSNYIRNIIIATTEDSVSEIRSALSNYKNVKYFIGSKNNVLERYFQAARQYESEIVVRATGDNPLVCPEFLDKAIEIHCEAEADLTHFLGIPLGTGVEVIGKNALNLSYKSTRHPYDQEHVTPFIYKNRDSFKVMEPLPPDIYYAPEIRVTVDTPEDFKRVKKIFEFFSYKKYISMEDIINYHKKDIKIKNNISSIIPALV